jgi:glycosyltransferase involved in cell wall biosynthesis
MSTGEFVKALRATSVTAYEDFRTQDLMHTHLARRRVYLHPMRWTSLGLSLIEAMQLGMPVVALAATEAIAAVPAGAGVLSTDLQVLRSGFRMFLNEPEAALEAGAVARSASLRRFGLARFLADWDRLLATHERCEGTE